MAEQFCLFEAANDLLTTVGGIGAVLDQGADREAFDDIIERLENASNIWIADIADNIFNKEKTAIVDKASFYSDVVQAISWASQQLQTRGAVKQLIPQRAFDQLLNASQHASYYISHRTKIVEELKSASDSKEKVLAYFGDMLVR